MDHGIHGRRILAAIVALLPFLMPATGYAQTATPPPGQGPLTVELVHNPFVVATDYKVTDLDGEVGQRVGNQAAQTGGQRKGLGQAFVVAQVNARSDQGADAPDHPHGQPAPQLRCELRCEQSQHRAFERVVVTQFGDSVVSKSGL